jgi:hypothetical protein
MMFVNGTSRCLVCERLFTRDAARAHAEMSCNPSLPDLWLLKNSSVLILPLSPGHVHAPIVAGPAVDGTWLLL